MLENIFSMNILLPLLLIVAIVYGALETVGMFRNRAVKTIIAVVMGFIAVSDSGVVSMIYNFLPLVTIFFIIFFTLGFFKKSLGKGGTDNELKIIVMVLVLLLAASLGNSSGFFQAYPDLIWIIGVVVFLAILYAAYKMGK